MSPDVLVAAMILVALVVYALSGGADFGGGVWDLFARGPRKREQRDLIARAIAPIWEANHVWLILALVLLFVGFPRAFAVVTTALHIPLTLMLIGIVLRGSAFAFRSHLYKEHTPEADTSAARWSRVFAISSVVTPVALGICLGAIASGSIRVAPDGAVLTDFVSAWAAPFPLAIGLLTLALFAFLAATYLIHEAESEDLREDFRRRALLSAAVVFATAWIAFFLAADGAPQIREGLIGKPWSIPFHAVTGGAAIAAIYALWTRRYRLARLAAIGQVALIIGGWGLAQFPHLVIPDVTIASSAAPDSVLVPTLIVLGIGSLLLAPAFFFLYRLFKTRAG